MRELRDVMNNMAYSDVMDNKHPSHPDDEMYMECYRFWNGEVSDAEFNTFLRED